MHYNGPAVGVESVNRRKHRALFLCFSLNTITVQEGYGAAFAA